MNRSIILRIGIGGVVAAFHRLGKLCEPTLPDLIKCYRKSLAKHADETGWPTDGQSGWAWLFCSPDVSIFEHRNTRSSRVPLSILGTKKLGGALIVDRFNAYNRAPCKIQYCYAHLLREVQKLEDDFPDDHEISLFVSNFAPLLSLAMRLHTQELSDAAYYREAQEIKRKIQALISTKPSHLAIIKIQDTFQKNHLRLYHWVDNRKIPAHNNRAERELRQTGISRKISFGSQSEAGAKTRSILMSVLLTAKKRLKNTSVESWFKNSLDSISLNPSKEFKTIIPKPPP